MQCTRLIYTPGDLKVVNQVEVADGDVVVVVLDVVEGLFVRLHQPVYLLVLALFQAA